MAAIILPRKHYKQPAGKLVLSPEWEREALGVFSHVNEVVAWGSTASTKSHNQGIGLFYSGFSTGDTFKVSDSRLAAGRNNSTCVAFISREGLTAHSNGRPVYCERSEGNDIFKFGSDVGSTIRANFVFRNAAGSLSNNALASRVGLDVSNTFSTLAFVVDGESSRTVFADGNHATVTTTRSNAVNHCNHVSIGADSQDGAVNWDGGIFYVAVFGRSMSLDELNEISRNPWGLFRPEPVRLYSFAPILTPTLSSPGVIDIGTTSARPQVTLTY